jgi:hypothetical protein
VVLRPFLTEGLPFSLVHEAFHRQNKAVNKNCAGMGCSRPGKKNALKNSDVEFTIISLPSDPALNDLSIA